MSLTGSEKEKNEKLAAMWMYARQMGGGGLPPPPSSLRKIKLIPASTCGSSPPVPAPPTAMMLAPAPPLQYRTMSQPYMRPPPQPPSHIPLIYAPRLAAGSANSLHPTYQTQKSNKSADVNSQRRRRRAAAAAANGCGSGSNASHSGKTNAHRRQRRKSEADVVDGAAFTYMGLDRLVADSFLARQEQSNAGSSHVDYSSSASSSASSSPAVSECGSRPAMSRSSSKTKIVCRDVKM